MDGRTLTRWIAAASCAWLLAGPLPTSAREPPSAACIDLQDLGGGWRTGARELLIRSSGKSGAILELDAACPEFPQGVDLETFAPGGWACPGDQMVVRGGGTVCPIIRMRVLSESQVVDALQVREARMQASTTLDRVVVKGQSWRDIRGTTDRCVDSRFVRGWRKDGDGLVVEVAPIHHSGHRYYRVETVERCLGLGSAHSIQLVARSGGAAVCGRPGDKVVPLGHSAARLATMGGPRPGGFGRGCEIRRVTPLPRD